ncbi:hypothetical protein SVAN01_04369 [Stagonosporopsis vannaccii]|nr:hypothetical protein SVAN01_04369 [Stagonosporopsis vannaccii]
MLSVLLVAMPTLVTAGLIPSSVSSPTAPSINPKCTFTLWHRQQSSVDYIQLNTITDHANNIFIDVASRRPAIAFNSYTLLNREHSLAVTGLLDDASLSVRYAGDGVLNFQVGKVGWSAGKANAERAEGGERAEAWCDASGWKVGVDRRVGCVLPIVGLQCADVVQERRLDCVFPCEEADGKNLQSDEYEGAPGVESQAKILS